MGKHQRTDFDYARDELMSHIHRCGVLKASPEHQAEWLDETMQYMAERYPEMAESELKELQQIGQRFCQPVIAHGAQNTALETEADNEEQGEMAGAA